MRESTKETMGVIAIILLCVVGLLLIIAVPMAIVPKYKVWQKELRGKADLKEAEWNRKIKVEEGKAQFEAASYIKQADSIRAQGIAIANEIIARSITDKYIQWKWVEGLNDGSSEVIYVPTEANLPILEATRRMNNRPISIQIEEENGRTRSSTYNPSNPNPISQIFENN